MINHLPSDSPCWTSEPKSLFNVRLVGGCGVWGVGCGWGSYMYFRIVDTFKTRLKTIDATHLTVGTSRYVTFSSPPTQIFYTRSQNESE